MWQYTENSGSSTTTLYKINNFGGAVLVFIPSGWQLHIPPRIQIFLWLLAQDRQMNINNLMKRNLNKT
jgi:hypothetical protein